MAALAEATEARVEGVKESTTRAPREGRVVSELRLNPGGVWSLVPWLGGLGVDRHHLSEERGADGGALLAVECQGEVSMEILFRFPNLNLPYLSEEALTSLSGRGE